MAATNCLDPQPGVRPCFSVPVLSGVLLFPESGHVAYIGCGSAWVHIWAAHVCRMRATAVDPTICGTSTPNSPANWSSRPTRPRTHQLTDDLQEHVSGNHC